MDLVTTRQDYDGISWSTRMHLAQRMGWLMELLEPYLDGSFGDVQPGMVQAYVKVAHELGSLFESHKRPYEKPEARGIPVERVQQLLAEQEQKFTSMLEAAVSQAREDEREQLRLEQAARERLSLEQGRDAIRRQLEQVRTR
jgi:hypothetical protein